MIIHKLIARHLRAGADPHFYLLQANDAIRWMEKRGVVLSDKTEALDLGCEHGIFGAELSKRGCQLTFADQQNLDQLALSLGRPQLFTLPLSGPAKRAPGL